MYLGGRDNGTEVPMYSSVGTDENGGNLISMNWEVKESQGWPNLYESKTEMIGMFIYKYHLIKKTI